ncbi:MAG: autotransporter-associated beta strand repeat-containing protein, partial [Akkermansia sp.]|nr:autotransporter-associated beta strand repeat-containing protein [Akkermansia sp.]
MSLLATVAGITAASASETYSADGVNLGNILESTRFYDTDKGLYWKVEGQPYRGAQELYKKTMSFEFLGELQSRIQGTAFLPSAFNDLVHDGNSCWYCVGANILQYWESYYGVFYKGEEPLPYGYTYDTANLSTLAGTQSLDLHMFFYDNWTQEDRSGYDAGGDAEMAAVWYLATGKNIREGWTRYSQLVDDAADAGFFSDYFTENAASREAYYIGEDASDLISATDFLREAFGLDRDGNRATYGQIAYLGIQNKLNQGHALTCYGFTTGADGQLESLYLTNSDDKEYKVFQVYVGLDERGYLHLYEDAAHTKGWTFLDGEWDICDITYINTPTVLKEMYDEYTNAPLTWTGALDTWSSTDAAKATTEELPDADSGWQVYAIDDYYASYYQDGREVAFNDLATRKNVNLKGALSTPALHLDNNAGDYTFTSATGATLQADAIIKQGAGRAAFTKAALNAETVSVGMGALSLGANAPLTAQSGVVDNLGTLELAASGKAKFTDGLTIRDSGTLAVMGSATLTTTLTLEEGSTLYLNLGGGNTGSPLLTLDGNLNVLGDCSLTLNEKALTVGQSYILMNVSGSVTGWNDITTNCGELTLNGSRLILDYTGADKLTWTGGNGKWSKAQWDGGSAESADADVTFSRTGTTTITVAGTVSPHSMAFTQGTYTLAAGTGAAISGCRAITLGSGANVTSQVDLAGAVVSLGGDSKLTMGLQSAGGTLGGLEMAARSTLTLGGSTRYTVEKAGALNGTIQLNGTAALQLQTAMDTELYGEIKGNANTQLALTNSSAADDVTYYMGDAPADFLGTIAVGTDKETHRTTLRLDDASHKFSLSKSGVLSLRGNGSVTGTVNGTGTLTIERNANYQLAPGGTAAFGADILLNVEGTALIGTGETPITAGLPKKVTVSGNLTTYFKSTSGVKPLELSELTLQDGGSYTLVHTERGLYSSHTIDKLAVDNGGCLTNSIVDVETEVNPQYKHDIIVNTLSGSGTLDLETSSDLYVTKTIIKDTASGGYGGDIVIHNPHYNKMDYYANYDHGQVVEMQSGTVNGVVRLEAHGMVNDKQVSYGLAGFGVGGDITVKGLDDTESSKTTYLYSGSYSAACATKDISHAFANNIAPEEHTLTINAAEDYEFRGQVFAWLSLVKQGRGTQTFSGDTSMYEGGLRVDAGELVFEKGIFSAESVALNGGTLRLHGGKLAGLGGSGGTLALDAAAYEIDLTGASGKYTVQLNGATVTVTGDTDTLPGLGTTLTATGTSGITVDSGKKLTLQSAISNSGTLSLKGTIDVSKLDIVKNDDTHVDTAGKMGDSGFAKKAGIAVTVVTGGGTTDGKDATITHKDWQGGSITLGRDGKAGTGGEVDYTTYLLTGTDTAGVRAITTAANGKLKSIRVEGGTLTVDAASDLVNATGGTLNVTYAGTLDAALSGTAALVKTGSGTLTIYTANTHSGTTTVKGGTLHIGHKAALGTGKVTLSGGTLEIAANDFANAISATGTSGITVTNGNALTLQKAIGNAGTLTIKGKIDASALAITGGKTTHVDVYDNEGNSGFTKTYSASVTVVDGGTTVGKDATVVHNSLTLTLGSDGKATTGESEVDHSTYLLTGRDTASVSAITRKAGNALKSIQVEGGKLTVDAATELITATGGKIEITKAVNVGGSITGGTVTASAGTVAATIGGSSNLVVNAGSKVTLSGSNTYTGGTGVYADGVLRVTNAKALGTGAVLLSCGTLEIAANGVANKLTTSCSGSVVSVEKGYTLALNQAIENQGTVTLKGAIDASALKLTHDGVTHIDVYGNTGDSGFTKTGGASVTIVTGGTTKNGGTTITHKGLAAGETLVLGSNGKAVSDGTVDYSTYLLTGTASAGMEDITKMAGKKLQLIDLQGGTLDIAAAKGATLAKGVTLNMDSGKVDGLLIVGNGSTLIYGGGSFTVAPELKGGTLDLGGRTSITITGSKAAVTIDKQSVSVSSKGTILTDDDLEVKGGTVTLTALDGYRGDLIAEGGSTLKISTGKLVVDNDI